MFSPKPHLNTTYRGIPLGLLSISASLVEEYDIVIIDAQVDSDYLEKILSNIKDAVCLGISSMTGYQIYNGLEVAKAVKEQYSTIPIIWGGFHPSLLPVQTIENPYVDIIVRGQGQITFPEVVQCIKVKKSLKNVEGVAYKEKNGEIFSNQDRDIENVNNFSPLPYFLLDIEKYVKVTEVGTRTIEYTSSQSCPHRCGFCAEYKMFKRKWSGLSSKRVVEDIENLVKTYDINGIIFTDSNFFVSKSRVVEICRGLLEKRIKIEWGGANGRTSQLCKYELSTLSIMKKSGCKSILVGAESGSQEALNLINKDTKVEDTIKLAEKCKYHGIRIIFSCMTGLPPNNANDYEKNLKVELSKTFELIDSLVKISKHNKFMLFVYVPYPGTPLYELSLKNGLKEPKNLDEWSRFSLNQNNTPWMPEKYVKLANILTDYIFGYITDFDKHRILRDRKFKSIFIISYKVLHITSSIRWKFKFFSFSIEFAILRYYSKLVNIKRRNMNK